MCKILGVLRRANGFGCCGFGCLLGRANVYLASVRGLLSGLVGLLSRQATVFWVSVCLSSMCPQRSVCWAIFWLGYCPNSGWICINIREYS